MRALTPVSSRTSRTTAASAWIRRLYGPGGHPDTADLERDVVVLCAIVTPSSRDRATRTTSSPNSWGQGAGMMHILPGHP